MNKIKSLPIVTAAVAIVHLPVVTSTNKCPHCGMLQVDYIEESESDKTLLTSCTACDKDYQIYLPDFKIV